VFGSWSQAVVHKKSFLAFWARIWQFDQQFWQFGLAYGRTSISSHFWSILTFLHIKRLWMFHLMRPTPTAAPLPQWKYFGKHLATNLASNLALGHGERACHCWTLMFRHCGTPTFLASGFWRTLVRSPKWTLNGPPGRFLVLEMDANWFPKLDANWTPKWTLTGLQNGRLFEFKNGR